MNRARAVFALAALVVVPACYALSDFNGITGGVDSGTDAGDALANSCPILPGPPMVAVPAGFCIDSTEVTLAEYKQFIDTSPVASPQTQVSACSTNGTFLPQGATPWPPDAGNAQIPAGGLDWCDAYAYCQWAGKRLCGRIGGGPNPQAGAADETKSQWYAACSHGGARIYPYGNTFDPSACNGDDAGAKVAFVGAFSACVGGYDGIVDMAGNVAEWEDSCDTSDNCLVRGGNYNNPSAYQACAHTQAIPRTTNEADKGIRCCYP